MKKNLLKPLLVCIIEVWLLVLAACSNAAGINPENNKSEENLLINDKVTLYVPAAESLLEPDAAFSKFGTLADETTHKPNFRTISEPTTPPTEVPTITGLLGMTNVLTREVILKAYDSFNKEITSYIEDINFEEDAGLYGNGDQGIPDLPKAPDGKKYVQFIIYRDTQKNHKNIVMYEARIFTYNKQDISAKCVWFTPDLTVDIVRRKNITKDKKDTFTAYMYPYATYKDEMAKNDYNLVEEYYFTDEIYKIMSNFGTISNLTSCRNKAWPRISDNKEDYFIISKYYQYDGNITVGELATSKDTVPISDTNNIWAANYTGRRDNNISFIELLAKVNRETNKIELFQLNYPNYATNENNQNNGNNGPKEITYPININDETRLPVLPVKSIVLTTDDFYKLKK